MPAADMCPPALHHPTLAAMLSKEEVKRDQSVFRPDGLIVVPRSDGDATRKPSPENQQPPNPGDEKYDYRQVLPQTHKKVQDFLRKTGNMLAVDFFGLKNDRDWRLQALPRGYTYTLNLKKPANAANPDKVRSDLYLYGSTNLFRTSHEFVDHVAWLCLDPEVKKTNCACKYCSGKPDWKKRGEKAKARLHRKRVSDSQQTDKSDPRPAQKQKTTAIGHVGTSTENSFEIRAQKTSDELPGVPIVSTAERDKDLRMVEKSVTAGHEGFRKGEYIFYTLKRPIIDAHNADNSIFRWPAFVYGVTFEPIVAPPGPDCNGATFSLTGRVTQKRKYNIVLLGTKECLSVPEDRLLPCLAQNVDKPDIDEIRPNELCESLKLDPEALNLENDLERSSFNRLAMAYLKPLAGLSVIRSHYTLTDSFRSGKGELPRSVHPFATKTSNGDSMQIDECQPDPSARPALAKETGTALLNDTNKYWQGMFLGFERVWVGDLVRLRLTVHDAKDTINALKKDKKLYQSRDRTKPDYCSPFVLRIKAIYRGEYVRASKTDDGIRVVGDLFRIVPDNAGRIERHSSSDSSNSFGGGTSTNGNAEMASETQDGDDDDGTTDTSAEKKEAEDRPTYPIPVRPFLEAACDSRLPLTQRLPPGFGFERVNKTSTEVVFCIQHIAGRLYPSLAKKVVLQGPQSNTLTSLAEMHRRQPTEMDENTSDPQRAYLSLAGLISGCAKSMGIETFGGRCYTRMEFDEKALEYANAVEEHAVESVLAQAQADNGESSTAAGDEVTLPRGWKRKWSKTQKKYYFVDGKEKGHWRLPDWFTNKENCQNEACD